MEGGGGKKIKCISPKDKYFSYFEENPEKKETKMKSWREKYGKKE